MLILDLNFDDDSEYFIFYDNTVQGSELKDMYSKNLFTNESNKVYETHYF